MLTSSLSTQDNSDYVKYLDAVKQGLLSEKDLDIAVKRLFTARMRLGMFDPPDKVLYAQTPDSEIDSAAHRELALKAARESMVLLKNDGVLPFAPNVKKFWWWDRSPNLSRCSTATIAARLRTPSRRWKESANSLPRLRCRTCRERISCG